MTSRQKDYSFLRARILGREDLSFFVKDYLGLRGCVFAWFWRFSLDLQPAEYKNTNQRRGCQESKRHNDVKLKKKKKNTRSEWG